MPYQLIDVSYLPPKLVHTSFYIMIAYYDTGTILNAQVVRVRSIIYIHENGKVVVVPYVFFLIIWI